MASVAFPTRVACYARVSTEDQAERQTIAAQTDFLRRYCELHDLPVAGVYVDDGISGATPLEDRTEGRRMLQDAEAGAFTVVLVYRLDRLGRSLKSLLAAHGRLDQAGVAIRSGTEPFDTASPIGRFLFSLLGSMAELERDTISERMTRGRDRVAKDGQYVGGPLPTGYDLDEAGRYVASARMVPVLDITEADLVRDIFQRIAYDGGSLNGEATRLTALGVPRTYRYSSKAKARDAWTLTAIYGIVHNPIYKGEGIIRSRFGDVEYAAPALVDADTWELAQAAVTRNRKLSKKNAKHEYHLRGLLRCNLCGLGYVGAMNRLGQRYYRCSAMSNKASARQTLCAGGILNADRAEEAVWQEVRNFIHNPGPYVEQAQRQLREQLAGASATQERSRSLSRELAGKEQERERVLALFRRGRITAAECDRELDEVAAEAREIREMQDTIRARWEMATASETYLSHVGAALAQMQESIEEIERTNDWRKKREMIELLVPRMIVRTEITGTTPSGRRRKDTCLGVTLAYSQREAVVSGRHTAGRSTTSWTATPSAARSTRGTLPSSG